MAAVEELKRALRDAESAWRRGEALGSLGPGANLADKVGAVVGEEGSGGSWASVFSALLDEHGDVRGVATRALVISGGLGFARKCVGALWGEALRRGDAEAVALLGGLAVEVARGMEFARGERMEGGAGGTGNRDVEGAGAGAGAVDVEGEQDERGGWKCRAFRPFCVYEESIWYDDDHGRLIAEDAGAAGGSCGVCASMCARVAVGSVEDVIEVSLLRQEFPNRKAMEAVFDVLERAFDSVNERRRRSGAGLDPVGTTDTFRLDIEPVLDSWPSHLLPRRPVCVSSEHVDSWTDTFAGRARASNSTWFGVLDLFGGDAEICAARQIRPAQRTLVHLLMEEDRAEHAAEATRLELCPPVDKWKLREVVLGLGLCELAGNDRHLAAVAFLLGLGGGEGARVTALPADLGVVEDGEKEDEKRRLVFSFVAALATWFVGAEESAKTQLIAAFVGWGAPEPLVQRARATLWSGAEGEHGAAEAFRPASLCKASVVQVDPDEEHEWLIAVHGEEKAEEEEEEEEDEEEDEDEDEDEDEREEGKRDDDRSGEDEAGGKAGAGDEDEEEEHEEVWGEQSSWASLAGGDAEEYGLWGCDDAY